MRLFKRVAGSLLLLGFLVSVWEYQAIYQWWFLRNYHPAPEIVALADNANFSDPGRQDFYLANPKIDDKVQLNAHCPVSERSLVLGCYSSGRIYVLKVDRTELIKVMNVTAAHEMLHAAYADLPKKERNQVNRWIEDFYKTVSDPKLQKLVAEYEQSEPGERLNELHSILATQLTTLSPELENYYKQYFRNRGQVVADYASYEAVFENIENQIADLRGAIDALKSQLSDLEKDIDSQRTELEATNQQLDSLLAADRVSEYNSLVPKQNAQVSRYNNLVSEYRSLVEL